MISSTFCGVNPRRRDINSTNSIGAVLRTSYRARGLLQTRKAIVALPIRADPEISDEFPLMRWHSARHKSDLGQ